MAIQLSGQELGTVTIAVTDPSAAAVPGVRVVITDSARSVTLTRDTRHDGLAIFDALAPGDYAITVMQAGFAEFKKEHLIVQGRDRLTLTVELKVAAAATTTVEVRANAQPVSTDPGESVSMEHSFLENIPVNGRNIESLILLTPGITNASGTPDGGFNSNGLRSNTNYYTLDGVSSNRPVQSGPGGGFGGPRGGGTTSSSTADAVTIDSLQEMRVQTSAFAPEFGRTPGAQISMTSRSGTNSFHGSLFYYLRNDRFDANDWFANAGGYGRSKERQNRPGGVFGGPAIKNRTFFFISYEQLNLTAPYSVIVNVPDLLTRRSAPAALRTYLNAFPLPNGPSLSTGTAQYRAVVSNDAGNHIGSLRVDHTLTQSINLFARISISPSDSDVRGSGLSSPNVLTHNDSHAQTFTAGLTKTLSGGAVNELRANFSKTSMLSTSIMDNFGGAVPLTDSQAFPKGVTSAAGSFSLSVIGLASYSLGGYNKNSQQQFNVIDSLTKIVGNHQLKIGVDYRRIMPTEYRKPYTASVSFNGVAADTGIFSGKALNAQVSSNLTTVYPLYTNASAYVQDAWRISPEITVTYGLRWDVNPAPSTRGGPKPFAVSNDTIAGVTQNDPLYETSWLNIAPRVGLAWQLSQTAGRELILRTGFGVFYDVGYEGAGAAFSGAPYSSVRTVTSVVFPLTSSSLIAPALPPTRPYGFVTTADPSLVSPKVYQWNTTLEKGLGGQRWLSVGYAGSNGTKLLHVANQPSFSSAYDVLSETSNGASSDYHALQVQFRQRASSSLQIQLGYTWSHSIDSASNDAGFTGFATLFGGGNGERGSSDFDIRQNLSLSGTYHLPAPKSGFVFEPIRNWYLDFTFAARTGLPFGVQGVSSVASGSNSSTTSPGGLFAQVRPNLTGQPIWIDDPKASGGRRLNKAAFSLPTTYVQGDLGRNALRGFGMNQLDFSLRRTIAIRERWRLNIGATGYNILNHPNFANPSMNEGASLSSPNFGVSTQMLNQSFFGGGGANTIYRSGGPRTMELTLRLQF